MNSALSVVDMSLYRRDWLIIQTRSLYSQDPTLGVCFRDVILSISRT